MFNFTKFVDYNAGLLRMDPPDIVLVPRDDLNNESQTDVLFKFVLEENTIYFELKDKYELIDYYNLSYAMRRIWQDINALKYDFSFFGSDQFRKYSEIDAYAFACIAIAIRFNKIVRQTIKSDSSVQEMLDKRIDELAEEFDIDIYIIDYTANSDSKCQLLSNNFLAKLTVLR